MKTIVEMWFTGDIGSAVATVQRESKILLVFGFGTDDLSKEVDALFQKSSQIGANQITFEKKFSKIFKKKISKIYNKKFQKFTTKNFKNFQQKNFQKKVFFSTFHTFYHQHRSELIRCAWRQMHLFTARGRVGRVQTILCILADFNDANYLFYRRHRPKIM